MTHQRAALNSGDPTLPQLDGPPDSISRSEVADRLPAWPVLLLLWGVPVWWLLGLFPLSSTLASVPMLVYLLLKRQVLLVPGVLPYIALLVWMAPSALLLDGGLLGFAVRYVQLASAGVILTYVVNARENLPDQRILAGLAAVWVAVIGGGYLGMLAPNLELTWTVGRLLPGGIASHGYIRDLVFPSTAEVQTPWGAEEPFVRPSAPFAYTNGWGASMALLTPCLLANAWRNPTALRLVGTFVALVLAVPPALATTNRGLFLTWGVTAAYVVVRLLLRGQFLIPAVVGLGTSLVAASGGGAALLRMLTARQDVVNTTEGRASLYREAYERTLHSPLLGFGAPRQSTWSEIFVGTQGMVWNMLFCFGFVGLGLFLWFIIGLVARTISVGPTWQLLLHAALVAAAFMSIFYGLDRHLPYLVVIAGLLLRTRYLPAPGKMP